MNEVIVIASCNGKHGLVDIYERGLQDAGIERCFEIVPFATSSFNMQLRIQYWRGLAERFINYKMIIVTDAWDVLFFGRREDLYDKVSSLYLMGAVMISAEKNCFPGPEFGEEDLSKKITGNTSWKYANPGMLVANPQALLKWLDKVEKIGPLDISDQAWFNRRLVDNRSLIRMDTHTSLFYVISYNDGRLENGSLVVKNGRLWNHECDTYPNFVHFAGHGPLEARRVLPGHASPRYEAMGVIRRFIETGK